MRSSIPLQLQYSFHLDVIAQLHVYHPWHWRNVSFSESPHKTLIYKSLAEISPLAKLPSQAVDFQTQCLQSAAQHGTSLGEEIRRVGDGGGSLEYTGKHSGRGNYVWVLQRCMRYPTFTFSSGSTLRSKTRIAYNVSYLHKSQTSSTLTPCAART